jgi:6-phosphogluconate dehydrogenase
MELGYIGLGKMGSNMVARLLDKKYRVAVFDKSREAVSAMAKQGAEPAADIRSLVSSLSLPRLVWIMVPYGVVDGILGEIVPLFSEGDTLIDGGNSPFKESVRRNAELAGKGINFLDVGVSGGPGGARNGACLMVGGKRNVYEQFRQVFRDLSVDDGFGYMGASGSGHFVKMIHNGIEYGMMQAIAEGFSLLKASPFALQLKETANVYNHGSVIESRLIGWLERAFQEYGENLDDISGAVSQSGEGQWTVAEARGMGIPVPIIEGSVNFRIQSEKNPTYTGQILSALRNQFGGHPVFTKKRGDNGGKSK